MAKICPNCGENNIDSANFCSNCSADLVGAESVGYKNKKGFMGNIAEWWSKQSTISKVIIALLVIVLIYIIAQVIIAVVILLVWGSVMGSIFSGFLGFFPLASELIGSPQDTSGIFSGSTSSAPNPQQDIQPFMGPLDVGGSKQLGYTVFGPLINKGSTDYKDVKILVIGLDANGNNVTQKQTFIPTIKRMVPVTLSVTLNSKSKEIDAAEIKVLEATPA